MLLGHSRARLVLAALALGSCVAPMRQARAADPSPPGAPLDAETDAKVVAALAKGRAFLVGRRDAASGGFGDKFTGGVSAGYTAMVVAALIAATPREAIASDATIVSALDFVAAAQKENGSIATNPRFANYETSAAVLALASARIAKYGAAQARARDFLVSIQIAGDESAADFGGFPYAKGQGVDLSNVQFAATALSDAELPADSPVWARMQTFLARVQNRSETNTFVAKGKVDDKPVEVVSGNDGGAVYAPGTAKVPLVARADGRYEAPSYGSMTYALLKCLLFSGAPATDARVVAAVGWIARHFTVERNPGFETAPDPAKAGMQGYYYYLVTMARALATYEKAIGRPFPVKDEAGASHDWRREIATKLVGLQRDDGSYVNETAERWDEGNALLATSYALQTLAICRGRLP